MIVTSGFYKEFEIDLTTSCNLRCPLCTRNYSHAQHSIDSKYKSGRSLIDITNQLDTFPNFNRCMLAGAISEPTLYKDLFGFIEYLNSRDIMIELYTNGDAHNDEYWRELGEVLKDTDSVHFTICGSTQELHEKYRIGGSLGDVLSHARALRSSKKIDLCQYIIFNYNEEDSKLDKTKEIMSEFSQNYFVQSEGKRRLNEKINDTEIKPTERRNDMIDRIFRMAPKPNDGKKYTINCKFLEEEKIFITASGEMYPCYTSMEHQYMSFSDGIFDYTKIQNFEHPDCFLCERKIKSFIDALGLDFVC